MTKQRTVAALCLLAIIGVFFFNNCSGPKELPYDSQAPLNSLNSTNTTPANEKVPAYFLQTLSPYWPPAG